MALLYRVSHQGIFRLKIQDVILVDAGRKHHERSLEYGRRDRLVLDELDQLVLENHRALADREILADLEHGLVRGRNAPLVHVLDELANSLGEALALRLEREL